MHLRGLCGLTLGFALQGCGTIQQNSATEQLLASDAVDSAIAQIDFSPLSGQKVFFDTRYVPIAKTPTVVATEYIISGLRQSMTATGLFLQDSADTADYVVEARVGTLGSDVQDVVYGLPASNALSAAGTAVAAASQAPIPAVIPEISLAKKKSQLAAAKIACFAYHRDSRERVWQSGLSTAKSVAKDAWFLGAGPFQKGSIYEKTGMAGSTLDVGDRNGGAAVTYREPIVFEHAPRLLPEELQVLPTSGEVPAKDQPAASVESTK